MARRTLIVIGLGIIGLIAIVGSHYSRRSQTPTSQVRVAIVYTQPYPVLNDAIAGFKKVFLTAYPNATFWERHANGRPEEYGDVVLAAIHERPSILVPLTTAITSLSVRQVRGAVPVVFIAVTDPVGAGVAESLAHPKLSTGASDLCPYASLLSTARLLAPKAKVLGLPYNPSDQPAVFGRAQLLSLAPKYGFVLKDAQFGGATELATVVRGLATRTDAIIIGSDNLAMENASQVANAAAAEGRPTFACDSGSVAAGALAGVNIDYTAVGRLAGERAVQVMRGRKAGSIPIGVLNSGGLAINRRSACTLRIAIPPSTIALAGDIEEKGYKCPSQAH